MTRSKAAFHPLADIITWLADTSQSHYDKCAMRMDSSLFSATPIIIEIGSRQQSALG